MLCDVLLSLRRLAVMSGSGQQVLGSIHAHEVPWAPGSVRVRGPWRVDLVSLSDTVSLSQSLTTRW